MELKHTPELLREQGFVNIEDLCELLNLSRTGFYNFLRKVPGVHPASPDLAGTITRGNDGLCHSRAICDLDGLICADPDNPFEA